MQSSGPRMMNRDSAQNSLLWLVGAGFFMETLDSTIVNTALPAMAKSLHESPLAMHSVVVTYSLTIAILIPASGWIADRLGTRRTFFSAILLFSIGSLLCACSQSVPQLVAARVVQGIGGSMLLPVGRLAVLRNFPGELYLPAISFVSIPGLIGPLIGPTLGGWLVSIATWHWIFLINLPVGLLGCLATLKLMPDNRNESPGHFDGTGYAILAVSMLAVSLSIDGLSDVGSRHASVHLLMIFGLSALAAYWLHASRSEHPLFSLKLFRIHTFSIGLLGNLFARIGSGSMPFLIPLFLQIGLKYSPMGAGMMMIPVAAAGIASKRGTPPLIRHFGYRRVLVVNTWLVGLSVASFAFIGETEPLWLKLFQLFFFGAVNAFQFTAMNSLTLTDLGKAESSSGNSLFSMVQLLSMSLGVAAGGALLNAFTRQISASGETEAILRAFHYTFLSEGFITCSSSWIFYQLVPGVSRRGAEGVALRH